MIAYAQMFFVETMKLFQRFSVCVIFTCEAGVQTRICRTRSNMHVMFDAVNCTRKKEAERVHVYARFCNIFDSQEKKRKDIVAT